MGWILPVLILAECALDPRPGWSDQPLVRVDDVEGLEVALLACDADPGPHLILVKAGIAPVKGIPRVSHSPTDIRDRFRSCIQRRD